MGGGQFMAMGLDPDIDHEQQQALVDPDHRSPRPPIEPF